MPLNSHIQIPDSFLKKFSHTVREDVTINGKLLKNKLFLVWYLQISNGVFGEIETKDFYTSFGYYTDENEKLLSRYFEGPMGDIASKIRNAFKRHGSPTLSDSDFKTINGFITISLARSKELFQKIYYYSKCEIDMNETIKLAIELIEQSPNEYEQIEILHNTSGEDFVIPTCCCVYTKTGIVIPLFPNIALLAKPSAGNQKSFAVRNITNANEINEINYAAIASERNYHGVVVFKTKEQIERMAKKIKMSIKEKESN